VEEYRPLAKNLCQAVVRTLKESEESLQGQSDNFTLLLNTYPAQKMPVVDLPSFIWCWPNSRRRPVS